MLFFLIVTIVTKRIPPGLLAESRRIKSRGEMLLLDFASQSDRVSSHIPKSNDINDVTVDVIDDLVEAVHHIAPIHYGTIRQQWLSYSFSHCKFTVFFCKLLFQLVHRLIEVIYTSRSYVGLTLVNHGVNLLQSVGL